MQALRDQADSPNARQVKLMTLPRWPAVICALLLALPAISDARIKRSQSVKVAFKRNNYCPSTGAAKGPCKGYVIDHITPLACGGADVVENMQWQTIAEGKAKDRWERRGC